MSIRRLALIPGLIAMAAVPFAAQAHGPDKAANACIQAFVDTYLPKDRQIQVRTVPSSTSPVGTYTRRYTLDLTARLSRSGTELVSARCVASANGQVIELESAQVKIEAAAGVARLK